MNEYISLVKKTNKTITQYYQVTELVIYSLALDECVWVCVQTCVSALCVLSFSYDTTLSPSQLCCQVGNFVVYILLSTCSRADFFFKSI